MTTPRIRYTSQLDNYRLRLEYCRDARAQSVVEHEMVGRDGAMLEAQGMKARRCSFRAWFWKDTFSQFREFVDYVGEKNRALTFVHPQWGLVYGKIVSTTEHHNDLVNGVAVDCEFVEDALSDLTDQLSPLVVPTVESSYVTGQATQMARWAASVRTRLGASVGTLLSAVVDPLTLIREQFVGVSVLARDFVNEVDTFVSTLDAAATDITAPATSVINAVSFGTDLPGRVIGSVARAVDRYAESFAEISGSPALFANSFSNSIAQLKKSFDSFDDGVSSYTTRNYATDTTTTVTRPNNRYKDEIDVAAALQAGVWMAHAFEADEQSRDAMRKNEGVSVFDKAGRVVVKRETAEILTVDDMEKALFSAREMISTALLVNPDMRELNDIAAALLIYVNEQKIERDRVITVDISTPMPLSSVCLRYNLPYTYMARLMSLNPQITNPNFVLGDTRIYVRPG